MKKSMPARSARDRYAARRRRVALPRPDVRGWLGAIAAHALLILLALTCLSVGCRKEPPPPEETTVVPVEVMPVAAATLEETTLLTGVLEAYRAVDVVSEVGGEVLRLRADVGDAVEKGAILASLEKEVLHETLNQAEAALLAAEARYELAARDFARDSTLYAQADIAAAAYDASRTAHRSAQAELRSARAQRALAARNLREADIRAPFAGILSRRHAELGMYVTPGVPLFRLVNIDSLRLVLGVAQRNVTHLAVGEKVVSTAEALGDRAFTGRIRSIAPEANASTRTFPVEIILPNPAGQPLRDGLIVRARLVLGTREHALAVPREAVLERLGDHYVYLVRDSVAVRQAVKLGSLIEDRYVIRSGLGANDPLVVVGMQNLDPGGRVDVVRTHPAGRLAHSQEAASQAGEEW